MDQYESTNPRPVNPRRRKRTAMQNFKEAYLPVILLALVVVLILIFVISSVRNAMLRKEQERQESIAASSALEDEKNNTAAEAAQLAIDAARMYASYDYDGAIAKLDAFSGDIYEYDNLIKLRDDCVLAKEKLVTWDDLSEVANLSFHMLLADNEVAFNHPGGYTSTLKSSYITTKEFSGILQELYDNDYVLIHMSDMISSDATGYIAGAVYLPEGKKPIILTETHVNYYSYFLDSDGDDKADLDRSGFANKLVLDANGKVTCEITDENGKTVTGNYDAVPILNAFVDAHPDFSYRGAKATLAVTGYDGVFGYRTYPGVKDTTGEDYYKEQVAQATAVATALRNDGYKIASYTYDHAAYGSNTVWSVKKDIQLWIDEVAPIVGDADTLVFAKDSDIKNKGEYTGDKFEFLHDKGFRFFMGFCDDEDPWYHMAKNYVRQGRLLIYGDALEENPEWYEAYFDVDAILDPER